MPKLSRPSARHVSSLDGFRGLAFLLVFMRHYLLSTHLNSRAARLAMSASNAGWIGVDLFFTLSGFLITGILLDTRSNPGYFRNFYARRSLRIFPLYYGVFVLLLLLTPVLHLQWHPGHIAYLFYVGNIASGFNESLATIKPAVSLAHLWSLSVEEQFYLAWPCVVFFIARRRHFVSVCCVLSLLALALRAGLLASLPLPAATQWCYVLLPTHMDGLLYGAVAAALVRSRPIDTLQPLARRVMLGSGLALAMILATSGADFHTRAIALVGYPLLAAFFSSILLQALVPGSPASQFGQIRFLRFLGKYSYGLYVYHLLLSPAYGWMLASLQARLHSTLLGGMLFVVLVFAGSIVLAVASFQLYEKHWLRLKRFFEYEVPVIDKAKAAVLS